MPSISESGANDRIQGFLHIIERYGVEKIFYEIFIARDFYTRDREHAGIKCECKDNKFSRDSLNFMEKIFYDMLKPKNYKKISGYICGNNIDLFKDMRMLNGSM